tara:strand:- start:332 stop:1012 length:681 start_codon:yes stop_codon:yes gene_type:complete
MQRFLDIIFSFTAIIFLIPFLVPIIILLRVTGENEVFYIQERVGINGINFGLYKFATMLKDSPNIGSGEITIKNDPRVLPIGRFLRKTKLNELPQLINILRGDMSIVGPRPMVPNTYLNYPDDDKLFLKSVRPGLTGIGSIVFRDEELFLEGHNDPKYFYNEYIVPYKSSLEVWYVQNRNLFLYLKCIFVTIIVVLFPSLITIEKIFKDLPKKPEELNKFFNINNK